MKAPTIRDHMTPTPQSIGKDQTLAEAHRMMRAHRCRHLPVLSGGRLVGIVSERDLLVVEALRDVSSDHVSVEEAMTAEVFTVDPDEKLESTALDMAEHKYGSAVVIERGRVVGVFTTTDALRALAGLLSGARRAA
jgi:acetoin utilization protein AcuB